jgi:hypothetical protein
LYKAGAAHPVLGDEARQHIDSKKEGAEFEPNRAILALRHPKVSGLAPEDLRKVYAPKLQEGGRAIFVDDSENRFEDVKLMANLGETMKVMLTRIYTEGVVFQVPTANIFGGWPARVAELTCPVRLLAEDVEFMWPEKVYDVEVKRAGECVDPNSGLGTLLRRPEDLSITINGIDYPLEHDTAASKASTSASKKAGRQRLLQVARSEFRLIASLLLLLAVLECRINGKRWERHFKTIQSGAIKDASVAVATASDDTAIEWQDWSSGFDDELSEVEQPGEQNELLCLPAWSAVEWLPALHELAADQDAQHDS